MGNCCNPDGVSKDTGNINVPLQNFESLERSGLSTESKLRIITKL
jgi:hypothetical protein